MERAISRSLAVLVVVLLGAPAALRFVPRLPERPLVGRSAEEFVPPPFTLAGWFSGTFQRGADIRATQPDVAACDSETCRWQITHGSGVRAVHPVAVLAAAYGIADL